MRALFLFLLLSQTILAQKEDHQWIFNFSRFGIDSTRFPETNGASILDFNSIPPTYYQDTIATMDIDWTHASICDENGQLLFYSNGMRISKGVDHLPLPGGQRISYGPRWELRTWEDEFGVEQPYGFAYECSNIFLPYPDHQDRFLHIYVNYDRRAQTNYVSKLFCEIGKNDQGQYAMLQKDKLINDKLITPGVTSYTQHANGRDWWWYQFTKDTVFTYLIDPRGINLDRLQFLPFELTDDLAFGQAKFNAIGNKLAFYHLDEFEEDNGAELVIMDVDRCSGDITNAIKQIRPSHDILSITGLEFSPNGRYLYIANHFKIHQFDLNADSILASEQIVEEYNGSTFPSPTGNSQLPSGFGFMQRGPDNKIYVSRSGTGYHLHLIHKPDLPAEECQPEQNAIRLPTYHRNTLPNFPTLRLGPIDGSPCDTLGINNNPVSKFRYEQDSTDYLSIDFIDLSYYEPAEWLWDFGDGNQATDRYPSHNYQQDGSYEVCLTVSNNNSSNTACDTLRLGISSLAESDYKPHITLFPNPVESYLRIALHDYLPAQAKIRIYSIKGQAVAQHALSGQESWIDLSQLSTSTYIYEILDQGKVIKIGKLVKL